MLCNKCQKNISIKDTERYISLLCRCGMKIIYPDGQIKTIPRNQYDPQYKNKNE